MTAEEHQVIVQRQDLEKMADVMVYVLRHHKRKDEMNAALHMTPTRYSPLTSSIETVKNRLDALLSGIREEEETDDTDGEESTGDSE